MKTLAKIYELSSLYSRDSKDSRVLELGAANDLLNSLIRLEVNRRCRWKSM
jgi:hypothetical protein